MRPSQGSFYSLPRALEHGIECPGPDSGWAPPSPLSGKDQPLGSVLGPLSLVYQESCWVSWVQTPPPLVSGQIPHPPALISWHLGLPSAEVLCCWFRKFLPYAQCLLLIISNPLTPTLMCDGKSLLVLVVSEVEPDLSSLPQNPHHSGPPEKSIIIFNKCHE